MQSRNNSPKDEVKQQLSIDNIPLDDLILIEQGKIPDPFYTHGKKISLGRNSSLFSPKLNKITEIKDDIEILSMRNS